MDMHNKNDDQFILDVRLTMPLETILLRAGIHSKGRWLAHKMNPRHTVRNVPGGQETDDRGMSTGYSMELPRLSGLLFPSLAPRQGATTNQNRSK
jgi:hypothetical protein